MVVQMKTEIQETSEEAFKDVKNTTKETRCLQVYEVIKRLGSCPNSVIGEQLKLKPNQITGRVNELRNYFKVVGYDKKDYCPLQLRHGVKRLVMFWKVVRDFDKWVEIEAEDDHEEFLSYVYADGGRVPAGTVIGWEKKDADENDELILKDGIFYE